MSMTYIIQGHDQTFWYGIEILCINAADESTGRSNSCESEARANKQATSNAEVLPGTRVPVTTIPLIATVAV